ncbi:hypothetical protein SAMN05660649_03146 [Desulfotomaculum arcticum]|uniref:SHOCT-like domain-containing protein n=1 Tax=Desulfotruncus arcticus DSM 17038 TaxID=1121424 RepID=A0A1I2VYQ8_9FIRM|nr:SHOCT domain-containing protein [Desulfotruncus arcticus]SFG92431.1 hypothetical protein SAMN05660649_03146 [Desulfotomaculum arcticum] [Desulfotruncus arcticus DSM 17038]
MLNENLINYQLSLHILDSLRKMNLITEEEFMAIDKENKKSFKAQEYQGLS